MSSSLLLALAAGLLSLAFVLALVVLAGVFVLFWMRSASSAPPPAPRPDPVERERRKAAARGRASSPPERPVAAPPSRPPPTAPAAPSSTAGPLQHGPMIGFFDDETSTGAAMGNVRQASLSSAFLSVPPGPPQKPAPPSGGLLEEDRSDAGDSDATEIFSANTVSAELAALLEEPDDPAPQSPFATKK